MKLVTTLIVLLALGGAPSQAERSPEASALDHFIGTWDVSSTDEDGKRFATGERTIRWVLDGAFVQTKGYVRTADGSNDFEIIAMMHHDRRTDRYRSWSFLSNGLAIETEMTWDATSRTMTAVTRYGEMAQTTTSRFVEDGVEQWTLVNTNAAGDVVSRMQGVNRRRAE